MRHRVLTVGCLLWVFTAAPLLAQRSGMPVTLRPLAQLALNPGVLSELGIEKDAPVTAEITKLTIKIRQSFGGLNRRGAGEGSPGETAAKLNAEYNAELKKLLTADQYTRLQQIQWQLQGNLALQDSEVIAALELTQDQQKQISEAAQEAFRSRVKLLNQGEGIADVRKQLGEVTSEWKNAIDKILTKEQSEKFEKLENKDKLGFHSLTEEDLAKQLELSKEQREKLDTLKGEMQARQKKIYDAANARGNRVPDEVQAKVSETMADQDKKIAGILTADQQKRFSELKGKPFDRAKMALRLEPKAEWRQRDSNATISP
jgi:hypothetical protein